MGKESKKSKVEMVGLERKMASLLTELNTGQVLRSKGAAQKEQRNQMLNILCTLAMISFNPFTTPVVAIRQHKSHSFKMNIKPKPRIICIQTFLNMFPIY